MIQKQTISYHFKHSFVKTSKQKKNANKINAKYRQLERLP